MLNNNQKELFGFNSILQSLILRKNRKLKTLRKLKT